MILVAEGIRLSRGGVPILRDVSIGARVGELVAVLGPNGAGKSTLLQVLAGSLAPDAGTVRFDGADLAGLSAATLARRRAVLQQQSPLAFPFRVVDVVRLGRSPHAGHRPRRGDLDIAAAALAEADVLGLADRVYTTLSGGERQRVQLARVLAQIWPDGAGADADSRAVLLLDEPTSALDIAHQHAILDVARRRAARGAAVVAVLHDPNLAALHADRVVLLEAGTVAAAGTPGSVLTPALLGRVFGLALGVFPHPTRSRPILYAL